MASGRQARRNVLWQFIDPSYYGARMREVKGAAQQVARRLKSLFSANLPGLQIAVEHGAAK